MGIKNTTMNSLANLNATKKDSGKKKVEIDETKKITKVEKVTVEKISEGVLRGEITLDDALGMLKELGAKTTIQDKNTIICNLNGKIYELVSAKDMNNIKEASSVFGGFKAPAKNFANIPSCKETVQTNLTTNALRYLVMPRYDTQEEAKNNFEADINKQINNINNLVTRVDDNQNIQHGAATFDILDGVLDGKNCGVEVNGCNFSDPSHLVYGGSVGSENKSPAELYIKDIEYDVKTVSYKQDSNGKWYAEPELNVTITFDLITREEWQAGDRYMDEDGYLFERNEDNGWTDLAYNHKPGDIVNYNNRRYKLGEDGKWYICVDNFKFNPEKKQWNFSDELNINDVESQMESLEDIEDKSRIAKIPEYKERSETTAGLDNLTGLVNGFLYKTEQEALDNAERDFEHNLGKAQCLDVGNKLTDIDNKPTDIVGLILKDVDTTNCAIDLSGPFWGVNIGNKDDVLSKGGTYYKINVTNIDYDIDKDSITVHKTSGGYYVTGDIKIKTMTYDIITENGWQNGDLYMDEDGYLFERRNGAWINTRKTHKAGDHVFYNGYTYQLSNDGKWHRRTTRPPETVFPEYTDFPTKFAENNNLLDTAKNMQ